MWWVLLIFSLITLVISLLLINVFLRITTYPFFFTSVLTLSIFLPLSIVFLLPIDLLSSSSSNNTHSPFYVKPAITLMAWKCNYWITFLLTWLILPFLQSWYGNGQFNTRDRIKGSIIEVLRFQAILFVFGILGLIYIISSVGFNFASIKSLVITISHIYALTLLLWLMSHSLISIPKNKFMESSINSKQLHDNYMRLPKLNEEMADVRYNLKESCGKIMKLNDLKDYNVEFRDWIIDLVDQVPQEYSDPLWYRGDAISNDQLTKEFMSKITKEFNSNFYRFTSIKAQFDDIIDNTLNLEDIVNSKTSKSLNFRFKASRFSPKTNYYIYNFVIPILNKIFAVALAILSVIIIESEILHSTRFSALNWIFKNQSIKAKTFENFTILIVVLTYMLLSALNSLSNIKIFNMYHLSRNQSSDPVSITFFIAYAARLTIPLSYNFTMLLNDTDNSFHQFLGKSLTLIPIGNILNDWLPRLILIPILLSFFNVYERVKTFISKRFDFEFYEYFDELEFDELEDVQNIDMLKKNSLIQLGQKIILQESNKISNGSRFTSNLRPFHIQRPVDIETQDSDNLSFSNSLSLDTFSTDNVWADLDDSNNTSLFSKIGNATSSFFNKFKSQPLSSSSPYERDNSLMSDSMINQYNDLEDDNNLII